MQKETYDLKEILTNEEMQIVLELLNKLGQLLESDTWKNVLSQAVKNIMSGQVSPKDLTTILGCLKLWRDFRTEHSAENERDSAEFKQTAEIIEKLQQLNGE